VAEYCADWPCHTEFFSGTKELLHCDLHTEEEE